MTTAKVSKDTEAVQPQEFSNVVHGTAENLLNKLEESLAATNISARRSPFIKSSDKGNVNFLQTGGVSRTINKKT